MLKVMRIFGMAFVRGTHYELERVADLQGAALVDGDKLLHMARGDKLVQVKQSHHVHANPGTLVDNQTIELPLESEDKKNG